MDGHVMSSHFQRTRDLTVRPLFSFLCLAASSALNQIQDVGS